MKVSELEGEKLNYWVALALGWKHLGAIGAKERNDEGKPWCLADRNDWWQAPGETTPTCAPCYQIPYAYSTDWSQGGPIIERERIDVGLHENGRDWVALREKWKWNVGPTPLIAAMRCFVASKFGEEVHD